METPHIDSTRIAQASKSALVRADIERREKVFSVSDLAVHYSGKPAIEDVTIDVFRNTVTAFIGPSGCGKSTFIRCFNRMNDLIDRARDTGQVSTRRRRHLRPGVDLVELRHASAWSSRSRTRSPSRSTRTSCSARACAGSSGRRSTSSSSRLLRSAALWDEVKDRLHEGALGFPAASSSASASPGPSPIEPDVILMDEPASALDPISTARIEDLMLRAQTHYTIVIVTHNMQQAARVSDMTAFFTVVSRRRRQREAEDPRGVRRDREIFTTPADDRTEDYVTGRFG